MLRTLAVFDVGQSTGVAIGGLVLVKGLPVTVGYLGSFTWGGRPLFRNESFCSLFDTVDEVWVEYPAANTFSKGMNITLEIAYMWRSMISNLAVPVQEVLPGTWKNSAARTFDMTKYVPDYRTGKNSLTKHERDAFAIMYWRGLSLKREHFGS